jgi:hypothetical protein
MFKRDWWQRYFVAPQFSRVIQSWDTAFKLGAKMIIRFAPPGVCSGRLLSTWLVAGASGISGTEESPG